MAPVRMVHTRYSEIVDDLSPDIGQRAWTEDMIVWKEGSNSSTESS